MPRWIVVGYLEKEMGKQWSLVEVILGRNKRSMKRHLASFPFLIAATHCRCKRRVSELLPIFAAFSRFPPFDLAHGC